MQLFGNEYRKDPMIKDLLKKTQPVVYQALENALTNRHVSHSYLFLGPAGTPKKQTAVLMAQSLLCEKARDDFACEECGTCRRVAPEAFSERR